MLTWDCTLEKRAHLVQINAPQVGALGVVAQHVLEDRAPALRAAELELGHRRGRQHLHGHTKPCVRVGTLPKGNLCPLPACPSLTTLCAY